MGCFFMEKSEDSEVTMTSFLQDMHQKSTQANDKTEKLGLNFNQMNENTVLNKEFPDNSFLSKDTNDEVLKYEDFQEFVETVNNSNLSWKAELNTEFIGIPITEVNKKPHMFFQTSSETSFQVSSEIKLQDSEEDHLECDSEILKYWDTPIDEIDLEDLPSEWDWTDIHGRNYVSPPRNQKNCGSCYTISTVSMLESRLRIIGEPDPKFSEQYLLSCSFYTEGCKGGYPILLMKFLAEFGIPHYDCLEYSADDSYCPEECTPELFVSDYSYIGGYYGASDEENMMKELRARGPIIGNMEPGLGFSFYKNGVYSEEENLNSETIFLSLREKNIEWEKVDHSLLVVGWGVDDGVKFWKVLNSWGKNWGEAGFFRIKRGTDEAAIESMASAGLPSLKS